jgi:hypothetical protein
MFSFIVIISPLFLFPENVTHSAKIRSATSDEIVFAVAQGAIKSFLRGLSQHLQKCCKKPKKPTINAIFDYKESKV